MPEYVVNRDQGFPVEAPTHKHLDVIELKPDAASEGVKKGYLVPVDPNNPLFTVEMATNVAVHRKKKADDAVAAKKQEDELAAAVKKDKEDAARRADELLKNPPKDTRKEEIEKILGASGGGGQAGGGTPPATPALPDPKPDADAATPATEVPESRTTSTRTPR